MNQRHVNKVILEIRRYTNVFIDEKAGNIHLWKAGIDSDKLVRSRHMLIPCCLPYSTGRG
jgi:hypothetical protein